jgi:molecular chaperone DnaK (HSP70)
MFGVNLGSQALVICTADGDILRNEIGGVRTSSLIAFSNGTERKLGEAAFGASAKDRVPAVPRLAMLKYSVIASTPAARHWPFPVSEHAESGLVQLDVPGFGPQHGVALLGALLSRLRATSSAPAGASVAFALPPCTTADASPEELAAAQQFARDALRDVAAVAGWAEPSAMPTAAEAAAEALARKFPRDKSQAAESEPVSLDVLLVDVGHSCTTVAAVRLHPAPLPVAEGSPHWQAEVLAECSDAQLGCDAWDLALFNHFAAQVEAAHGVPIKPASRAGWRLLDGCEQLRKLLSTMTEARVTVENLVEGSDVPISLSREDFGELIAPSLGTLRTMLARVLGSEQLKALASCELFGGGTRTPAVQEAVTEALLASEAGAALGAVEERRFGAKLDDASVALGAALLGARAKTAPPDVEMTAEDGPAAGAGSVLGEAGLSAAVAREAELAAQDAAASARAEALNSLEAFILEARGLSGRKHGHLVDGAALSPLLSTAEDWIYSEEGEAAGSEQLSAYLAELRGKVDAATASFRAAVETARLADERALQASSDAAAAERAASGEVDEDHDTRKLKFPDRLRMVQKNKEEGTELFKGGNFRPAAARYNKALTHAAKFHDLTPDQATEVDALKLSLHLNLGMCWLKITDSDTHLDQAVRACTDALNIDPRSAKALYRRACALEQKKQYEAAQADLVLAAEVDPEDPAVPKLMARVEAQIKRQLEQEKKMYGKMFG